MKKALYALMFSAAALCAASAQAQSAPYEPAVNEFDEFAKPFVLEDGTRVEFTQHAGNYYVKQERQPRMKLIPQSPGVFTTATGARIQFRDHGDTVSIRDVEKLAARSRDRAIVMAKQ